MKRLILLLFIGLLITAQSAWGGVPQKISYQGILTDGDGVVVPDNIYSIIFRLYDVSAGGTWLWQETQLVQVESGRFNVLLGDSTSLAGIAFDEPYYLALKVESDTEMQPRIELASAPYALNAASVDPDSAVTSLNGKTGDVTLAAGSNITIFESGDTLYISSSGAASDGDWTISGNNIYSAVSGNVGIGTPAPAVKLQLLGGGMSLFDNTSQGVRMWTDDFQLMNAENEDFVYRCYRIPGFQEDSHNFYTAGASRLYIAPDGVVGINTTSPYPAYRLQVNGSSWFEGILFAQDIEIKPLHTDLTRVYAGFDYYGGVVRVQDEFGAVCGELSTTTDAAGYLSVESGGLYRAFEVDGNYGGSGDGRIYGAGTGSYFSFNLGQSGNDAVELPDNAINTGEILDDPGVAGANASLNLGLNTGVNNVISRSLYAPAEGYVVCMGTIQLFANHINGTHSTVEVGVSTWSDSIPTTQDFQWQIPSQAPTGAYYNTITVQGVFEIGAAGWNTFYLLAKEISGIIFYEDIQLTPMYFRPLYGTVDPTAIAGLSPSEQPPRRDPLDSRLDAAAERAQSEADRAAYVQKELDVIRARLAEIEREMANKPK